MSGWGTGWGKENEAEMDKAVDEMIATGQSLTKISFDAEDNLKIKHIGVDLAKP